MMKHFVLALALAAPQAALAQEAPASLELCLSRHQARHAHYAAKVSWSRFPAVRHLVVGAHDTSRVVWVQKTYGELRARSKTERVSFKVADSSAYPMDIAIYDLSEDAWRAYEESCGRQDCYFRPDDPGVTRLSDEIAIESVAAMVAERSCPEG